MSDTATGFEGTPTTMTPDGTIVVKFTDPNKVGQTIEVTARSAAGEEVTFDVGPLDPLGCGEVSWSVPAGWETPVDTVTFMADDTPAHIVTVIPQ